MCYFSISLLLIAAGYVIGADHLPNSISSFSETAWWTLSGVVIGCGLSAYLSHTAEYHELRHRLRLLVRLTREPHAPDLLKVFDTDKGKRKELTGQGAIYLKSLNATLKQVAQELRKAHHKQLAEALEAAIDYYSALIRGKEEIPLMGGIDDRTKELATLVEAAKPSRYGLTWYSLTSSRMQTELIYNNPTGQ